MIGPQRHYLILEALTPIAHGDTRTGVGSQTNFRLFMRQGMLLNGRKAEVPTLSENALRTCLFRYPVHDHLVQILGLERDTLPQAVMNLLFSGGNMKQGSTEPDNAFALGHAVKRLYPSLDLLGGAVDAFILPRSRLKLACWPITREFLTPLRHLRPNLVDAAQAQSVFAWLSEETRTRGTGDESTGNQMLYSYEVISAGARFLVELTLDPHTPLLTADAMGCGLGHWDGYFGGQGRQGRGRMAIIEAPAFDGAAYLAHLEAEAEAMRTGLLDGTLGTGRVLCAP